jgi:prepilin-type N-terminal cleavage/methylation domain-containing protein/prepilin-type processing-associated H-X9-DG protein
MIYTTHSSTFRKAREDGFTFVELLVVLATVAILAVLLLPAIAGTKPNSQAFQCLENQRQLTLGWQMYAADNTDLLPPNDYPYLTAYYGAGTAAQARLKNWVVGTMAVGVDAVDRPYLNGGVSELLDPNTLLSPYVKNRAVYHCPADNYIDPYAGHSVHVRSYSMNSAVGTIFSSSTAMGGNDSRSVGSPIEGGWLSGSGYIGGVNPTWLTYGKMTSFTKPGPANTWVIMDENPRTINDGSIATSAAATPGNTYHIDYPAGNHNGAAAISFADGHVIIHKWQDPRTYIVTINGQGNIIQSSTHVSPDDADCFYLAPITSAPR